MTQITEFKPLENEDSEYDVAKVAPNKDHRHIAYFLMWTWSNVIQGKLDFSPNATFIPRK